MSKYNVCEHCNCFGNQYQIWNVKVDFLGKQQVRARGWGDFHSEGVAAVPPA